MPTVNLLSGNDSTMALTAPAFTGIHDILSTSDTTCNFAPSFGEDYSSSTVNNEWPLVREPDCDIGYIGELMEDRLRVTGFRFLIASALAATMNSELRIILPPWMR